MTKRLYRSTKEKMIGGVCGGMAEYFDIDPVLLRILFVVATFAGGSGILAYIICWIIIPERPAEVQARPVAESGTQPAGSPEPPAPVTSGLRGNAIAGIILIVIGGLFLADNFLPHFHFAQFWPILLIVLGAGILSKSTKR